MAAGAVVQGAVGFGQGLLTAPLLALIDPDLVPAPMLVVALSVALATGWRERAHLDAPTVSWAVVGRVPGVFAGAAALSVLSDSGLLVFIACIVLAAVASSIVGVRIRRSRTTTVLAGAASGFTGTATSIGGPPMAITFQDLPGADLRSLLGTFLSVGVSISLVVLVLSGQMDGNDFVRGLALVPGVIVGFVGSRWLVPVADRGHTRVLVLALSSLAAVALLARAAI